MNLYSPSRMICRCAAVLGATLATGIAVGPAWAGERELVVTGEAVPTRTFNISDLNLASDQGRRTVHSRLAGAVQELCGAPRPMTLVEDRLRVKCRKVAFESARPQIEAAFRNAQFAGRAGGSIVVGLR